MTSQTVGELIYKISGDVSDLQNSLKTSQAELKKLEASINNTEKTTKKAESSFKNFGTALKAAFVGFVTTKALGFIQQAVGLASQRIEQETKLAQVLRVSTNATDEQIRALKDQAGALEETGVLGREVITAVQGQLATFDLQAQSIKDLTPAILDYVAAEKGMNASAEEAQGLTNGLAQALQGKFQSLTAVGFVLDEDTKKMISNGTEAERIIALNEVLNSTYKGLNQTLAGTFLGTAKKVQNQFEDFKTDLGFAFIPALNSLGKEILSTASGLNKGADRVNVWGKAIYQVTNTVIAFAKAIKLVIVALTGVADVVGSTIFTSLKGSFEALSKFLSGDVSGAFKTLSDAGAKAGDDIVTKTKTWIGIVKDEFESVGESAIKGFDASGFEPVTDAAIQAYDKLNSSNQAFGNGIEDTEKKAKKAKEEFESFQEKMLDFIDKSVKVREALEQNLSEAFKKFGESISQTFEDANTKLADTFLKAESQVKDLNQSIIDERQDLADKLAEINRESGENDQKQKDDAQKESDKRLAKLQEELAAEQRILEARAGFEERQTEKMAQIRKKLTDAGIDPTTVAGLTNGKSLKDQIDETRQFNALDEFSQFELLQNLKLDKLTNDFIAEVTLTREKIDKQKAYEQDLTDFLAETTQERMNTTEIWAAQTIMKYKEVAAELRSLLDLQSQVERANEKASKQLPLFHEGGAVGGAGGKVHAGEYVIPKNMVSALPSLVNQLEAMRSSGGTTNNKTINAPISIQSNVQSNLDMRTLGREIAFELRGF